MSAHDVKRDLYGDALYGDGGEACQQLVVTIYAAAAAAFLAGLLAGFSIAFCWWG